MKNDLPTVLDLIRLAHENHASAEAYFHAGKFVSYGDLIGRAAHMQRQMEPYKKSVAVYSGNPHVFITGYFAGILSGRPTFLIPGDIRAEEVSELIQEYEIGCVLTDQELLADAAIINPVSFTETQSGELQLSKIFSRSVSLDDVAIVLTTSGTTGVRRAVPITHRNLVWTGREFNKILGLKRPMRELVLVPLAHSFGARRILAQLMNGGCVIVAEGVFNPAWALTMMRDHACEVLAAVPPQIRILQGRFRKDFERYGQVIRHVELSSAFMSAEEKAELVQILPAARIVMGYGLTEATRSAMLVLRDETNKLDTVGKPFPGVRHVIVDGEGREVQPGDVGEIVIQGPNTIHHYWGRGGVPRLPEFINGFPTGDLGYIDVDGYLNLAGRKDDVINVGGKKFHPSEIELIIEKYFPAMDCAIAKKSSAVLGFQPVLCVAPTVVQAEQILQTISGLVEAYKRPAAIVRVDAIPRTANGKVQRPKLNEMVAALSGEGA